MGYLEYVKFNTRAASGAESAGAAAVHYGYRAAIRMAQRRDAVNAEWDSVSYDLFVSRLNAAINLLQEGVGQANSAARQIDSGTDAARRENEARRREAEEKENEPTPTAGAH
jgi:hypothetical protein